MARPLTAPLLLALLLLVAAAVRPAAAKKPLLGPGTRRVTLVCRCPDGCPRDIYYVNARYQTFDTSIYMRYRERRTYVMRTVYFCTQNKCHGAGTVTLNC